jgi:bifunctional non-homologous end joining protein LigD
MDEMLVPHGSSPSSGLDSGTATAMYSGMFWRPRIRPPAGFIAPCLPSPASKPPSGPNWIHELKHDGFCMIARRDGNGVRLFTRNANDWSTRFPPITDAVARLKARSCLIDGEVVILNTDGLAVFDLLRQGPRVRPDAVLLAFDLLELDGEDLGARPIEERRRRLTRLLRDARPALQLSEHLEEDGPVVFEHACLLGCEGIVSKRRGTRYQSGRSRHWIKTKNPNSPAVKREAEEEWRR